MISTSQVFKLLSTDNITFTVDEKIINQSKVLGDMFQHLSYSSSSTPISIQLPSDLLKLIIDYCTIYRDAPMYDVQPSPSVVFNDIDKAFISKLNFNKVGELINAASYLDIPRLYDAGLLFLRETLRSKSFNGVEGEDNFTPDESRALFDKYVLW